jgi:hypothetical protein
MTDDKVRGRVVLEIEGDWEYGTREMLDWIEMKLDAAKPNDWGTGRGGINYASARVVSVETAATKVRQ